MVGVFTRYPWVGSSYRGYDYKSTASCIHALRSTPFLSTARQLVLICPAVVGFTHSLNLPICLTLTFLHIRMEQ